MIHIIASHHLSSNLLLLTFYITHTLSLLSSIPSILTFQSKSSPLSSSLFHLPNPPTSFSLYHSTLNLTMPANEDFGLNLTLSFPHNLMSSASNPPNNPSSNDALLPSSDRCSEAFRGETRSFLQGIDVNRLPSEVDCDEEAGVSSPNSTVSSVSGKRSEREANSGEEQDMDRACSRGISDEEDNETSRKKLRLSKDQSAILEESFKEHNTLNPKQKLALAKQLGLRPRQVEVWFQNRRARTKLKQTEVDCEFLKRCCENLTEENRRLQKEVHELRALKLSPQFYMHMTPPTTLTMCPSCERLADRPIPIGPWAAAAPISHRPFDALRLRS